MAHPREQPCRKAEDDLRSSILDVIKKYDLTTAETIRVVTGAMGGYLGNLAKHLIRDERHPNKPNRSGGLA